MPSPTTGWGQRVWQYAGTTRLPLATTRKLSAIEQALVNEHPERSDLRYNLTFSEHDLAEIHKRHGLLDEALAGYRRVLAIREAIAVSDPADVRARHGIASACMGLSDTTRQLKRFPEALRYAERAVAIQEQLAGAGRESSEPLARARWTLANAYLGWGKTQGPGAAGYLDQASQYYQYCPVPARVRAVAEARPIGEVTE